MCGGPNRPLDTDEYLRIPDPPREFRWKLRFGAAEEVLRDPDGRRHISRRADPIVQIGAPSRRRTAPVRAKKNKGRENSRVEVDTHHLGGWTALLRSLILLQLNGLVSSLLLQMRAGTSHDCYHYSWPHPAILPYITTCTTSRWRITPSSSPPPSPPFSSRRRSRNVRISPCRSRRLSLPSLLLPLLLLTLIRRVTRV